MSAFTTRDESDVLIVALTDSVSLNDFRNTPLRDELLNLIQARDEPRLALDMGRVDYLSSSGVAILVGLKRRLDAGGGKLVLFHVQPVVLDLLRVMRLDRHLGLELVGEDRLGVEEQAADQGRLAVVHRARGRESEQVHLAIGGAHQK